MGGTGGGHVWLGGLGCSTEVHVYATTTRRGTPSARSSRQKYSSPGRTAQVGKGLT